MFKRFVSALVVLVAATASMATSRRPRRPAAETTAEQTIKLPQEQRV